MAALSGLASALESYRGRDRLVRLGWNAARGPGVGSKRRDWETEAREGAGSLKVPHGRGPVGAGLQPCPLAVDI